MYSSKEVHKLQGVAFLGGSSAKAAKEALKVPGRFTGKQLLTKFPKGGNASMEGVLFTKFALGKSDEYAVGNGYLKSHPLDQRKMGFGSHDAPKKDEFMSGQRAEQHKTAMAVAETAEKEGVSRRGGVDAQIERLQGRLAEIDAEHEGFQTQDRAEDDYVGKVPQRLYDIGRTQQGTTPVFLHDARDQFYSLKRSADKPRHVQRMRTSSNAYGMRAFPPGTDHMIKLGGNGGNRSTFVDNGHLTVGNHED